MHTFYIIRNSVINQNNTDVHKIQKKVSMVCIKLTLGLALHYQASSFFIFHLFSKIAYISVNYLASMFDRNHDKKKH